MLQNKVVFAIQSNGLYMNKELHPQPMSKFIPDWYKNIKSDKVPGEVFDYLKKLKTAKTCPSFVEIFKEGYVVLAPQDYVIKIDEDGTFIWRTPIDFSIDTGHPTVGYHSYDQFHKFYNEKKVYAVPKLNLPIQIITPKGYSVRQMHFPYADTTNYETNYGVLKSDKVHSINIQIMFYKPGEYVFKQGTPLAVYVPFKREDFNYQVVNAKENKYKNLIDKSKIKQFGILKNQTNYYKD
tara:strand:- start:6 stop:719 length:714 start_codon:yes stop_codon:yes gene_type:complete